MKRVNDMIFEGISTLLLGMVASGSFVTFSLRWGDKSSNRTRKSSYYARSQTGPRPRWLRGQVLTGTNTLTQFNQALQVAALLLRTGQRSTPPGYPYRLATLIQIAPHWKARNPTGKVMYRTRTRTPIPHPASSPSMRPLRWWEVPILERRKHQPVSEDLKVARAVPH